MTPDLAAFNTNPKTPLGARITLGRQPPDRMGAGFPIAKDRFWIASPIADAVQLSSRKQHFLPLAPGFERYNDDAFLTLEQWDSAKTQPEFKAAWAALPESLRERWKARDWTMDREAHRKSRRTIRGTFIRRRMYTDTRRGLDGSVWLRRAAQEGDDHKGNVLAATKDRSPACMSTDSVNATRIVNGKPTAIPCLGERCPFAQKGSGPMGSQACQKVVSLVFQLRWPELCWRCNGAAPSCLECKGTGRAEPMPSPIVEAEFGGSYNFAADAITGFLRDVQEQWTLLSLPGEPDVYGLPFAMTLVHKTGEGKAYWTMAMSFDFPPGMTLQEWAIFRGRAQAEGRTLLAGNAPLMLPDSAPGAQRAWQETRHPEIPGVIDG